MKLLVLNRITRVFSIIYFMIKTRFKLNTITKVVTGADFDGEIGHFWIKNKNFEKSHFWSKLTCVTFSIRVRNSQRRNFTKEIQLSIFKSNTIFLWNYITDHYWNWPFSKIRSRRFQLKYNMWEKFKMTYLTPSFYKEFSMSLLKRLNRSWWHMLETNLLMTTLRCWWPI